MISLRNADIESFLFKIPFVKIHEIATLRSILTAFLTGLISITIFSFSMVMLVLSQAASHYSPKILNWMVGKKSNQYILGFYLGTIIFTLLLLIQLPENSQLNPSYHFAVVLDAILTFYCLTLFVKFISQASSDIQVSNITETIFSKTHHKLKKEINEFQKNQSNEEEQIKWYVHESDKSGYLQQIRKEELVKTLAKHDLKIKFEHKFGTYHIKGDSFYSLNKVDPKIHEDIVANFIFYSGEQIQDHTFYGFRQLSEIAVKALSPGINDPGTAGTCIDYLTDLFVLKMNDPCQNVIDDKENIPRIFIHSYSLEELFKICMIPILNYGERDINILTALLLSLRKLARKDKAERFKEEFCLFFTTLLYKINNHKENEYFYHYLIQNVNEVMKKLICRQVD